MSGEMLPPVRMVTLEVDLDEGLLVEFVEEMGEHRLSEVLNAGLRRRVLEERERRGRGDRG